MGRNRVRRPGGREPDEERLRLYASRVRRNEGLRRASNYTMVFAVLFTLSGAALGLFPELETVKVLRSEVEALGKERDGLRAEGDYLKKSLDLLEAEDPDFVESMARSKNGNLQAPGETLLRIPGHLKWREGREGPPAGGQEEAEESRTAP